MRINQPLQSLSKKKLNLLLHLIFDHIKSCVGSFVIRNHSLGVESATGKGVEVIARISRVIQALLHLF